MIIDTCKVKKADESECNAGAKKKERELTFWVGPWERFNLKQDVESV